MSATMGHSKAVNIGRVKKKCLTLSSSIARYTNVFRKCNDASGFEMWHSQPRDQNKSLPMAY